MFYCSQYACDNFLKGPVFLIWVAFTGRSGTQCNGNSQESTKVNLAKTPSNKEHRAWTGIFCNRARPQGKELGHQSNH